MSTLPAALGCISTTEDKLAAALTATAEVLSFLGAADADEALERIHFSCFRELPEGTGKLAGQYTREQLERLRPYLLVYVPDDVVRLEKRADPGSNQVHTFIASVIIELERSTPEEYLDNPEAADRDMRNHVGLIAAAVLKKCSPDPPDNAYPIFDSAAVLRICEATSPKEWTELGYCQTAGIMLSKGSVA